MPIEIKIEVKGNNAVIAWAPGEFTLQEISLALDHIKLREKDLIEEFEKHSKKFKGSKKK